MFAWARGLSNIYAHEHLASKLSVVYMLYTQYDRQCVYQNIMHDCKAISSLALIMIYNGDPPPLGNWTSTSVGGLGGIPIRSPHIQIVIMMRSIRWSYIFICPPLYLDQGMGYTSNQQTRDINNINNIIYVSDQTYTTKKHFEVKFSKQHQ